MPLLEDASVQYNDMKGTVALDWHGGTEIHKFAKDCAGVDLGRYFPLALSIGIGVDMKTPHEWFLNLTFYAADKSVVGESGEAICQFASQHDGKVPTKPFHGQASLAQFARYVKRFDIVLRPRKAWSISSIEYSG